MQAATRVDVLLSTRDGEAHLSEQLESLARQTHPWISLLIRDDGSTDATVARLEAFRAGMGEGGGAASGASGPGAFRIDLRAGPTVGIVASYAELLERSTAPYVLFCDQDDIWEPHKIATLLSATRRLEAGARATTPPPVLVHSDMRCIDAAGRTVAPSYWRRHGIDPDDNALGRLLLQNVVSGTACCFNRALLERAAPLPPEACLHDWWLALHAAAFGTLRSLPEPLVRYRLHGANAVGANGLGLRRLLALARSPAIVRRRLGAQIGGAARQAGALLERERAALDAADVALLEGFSRLDRMSGPRRKAFMLRHGVRFSSALRNAAALLL